MMTNWRTIILFLQFLKRHKILISSTPSSSRHRWVEALTDRVRLKIMMRTLNQINVLFPHPVMKWHSLLTPYVFYALTRIIVCHHRGHNKGKRTSGAPGQSKALSSLIGLLKVTWYILQQLWLVFISFFLSFFFPFFFF